MKKNNETGEAMKPLGEYIHTQAYLKDGLNKKTVISSITAILAIICILAIILVNSGTKR